MSSNAGRSAPFERGVYADLSWIDPDEYESAMREARELYRAGRNLDPNRPRKRSEDMTDQDYSDMTLDEYRAAVASGQYARHQHRHNHSAVSRPSRMPSDAVPIDPVEYGLALPEDDQDYARGNPRRAIASRQDDMDVDRGYSTVSKRSRMPSIAMGSEYGSASRESEQDYGRMSMGHSSRRTMASGQYDSDMDRRPSTVSRRSRMPSVAHDSGSSFSGNSDRLGVRGSFRQAIRRRLDPK